MKTYGLIIIVLLLNMFSATAQNSHKNFTEKRTNRKESPEGGLLNRHVEFAITEIN